MANALGPRHVGNVYQPIDAFFNFHKRTEIGQIAHRAFNPRTRGVLGIQRFPGIGLHLFQPQRNFLLVFIDLEHHDFHHVADRHELGRMPDVLRPRHFRNVHQPFHALLQFHKSAIIRNADDFAGHFGAHRIFFADVFPRMRLKLLHAQRDALAHLVVIEHFDFDFLADGQHI